ncbi:hypothetical protein [Actinoplanes sp. NPDC049265]|uniref:hypothetical protein n=1 Tax=Actinoplanes sp. NPDC049265 TaxID=3363902 RepID=UPI00371965B0
MALPVSDLADWEAQLPARAEEANRVREARAAERRAKAARRKAGMTARHTWRQLHLDARAAEAEHRRPG